MYVIAFFWFYINIYYLLHCKKNPLLVITALIQYVVKCQVHSTKKKIVLKQAI